LGQGLSIQGGFTSGRRRGQRPPSNREGWNSDDTISKLRGNTQFPFAAAPPYSVDLLYRRSTESGHPQIPDAAMPYMHGIPRERLIQATRSYFWDARQAEASPQADQGRCPRNPAKGHGCLEPFAFGRGTGGTDTDLGRSRPASLIARSMDKSQRLSPFAGDPGGETSWWLAGRGSAPVSASRRVGPAGNRGTRRPAWSFATPPDTRRTRRSSAPSGRS
jgi:hypothetical protein